MSWHRAGTKTSQWDSVAVPSTWSIDPRYLGYVGTAWYRRAFSVPERMRGRHLRLVFDAVFYEARVWVNGEPVGTHEGGYTPFELDATAYLKPGEENVVAVAVSNTWSRTTIPGARFPSGRHGDEPAGQVYPWWDYGGIIRDVRLVATSPVYVSGQQIVATPDLEAGTAAVETTVWITNTTETPRACQVALSLRRLGSKKPVAEGRRSEELRASVRIPPHDTQTVHLQTTLRAGEVDLWHPDHPRLYTSHALLWEHEASREARRPPPAPAQDPPAHEQIATFGIRKVELREATLLLNGEPIKLGGANRHSDYPGVGSVEPDSVIQQDMTLMKEGNMQLMRLHHYPSPKNALRWADRNGMLLIGEAGSWGFGPEKLSHPDVRALFRSQTEEMMRRDWNHPSIIAWSTGNEYDSDSPEGVEWTKDMYAFIKDLDESRPITFAALGGKIKPEYENPKATSLAYVDFISANFYFSPQESGRRLDGTHEQWPGKPIFVSEWGRRADHMRNAERVQYIEDFVDMIREREYVFGISFWSYNDYRSRYPGTAPDGYRHWGLVDVDRKPRPGYHAMRDELAPLTISGHVEASEDAGTTVRFHLTGRDDFPRHTLREYEVRYALLDAAGDLITEETQVLKTLRPGETAALAFDVDETVVQHAAEARLTVLRPTGFHVTSRAVALESGATSDS